MFLLAMMMGWGGGCQGEQAVANTWRTQPLKRMDVEQVVSATGALRAVTTVEVGTQISGVLSEIRVDFNARVKQGEVLALIDPSLLRADVEAAEVRLSEINANLLLQERKRDRLMALLVQGATTPEEAEVAEAEVAVAKAQYQAAEIALRRARRNLNYATITSPIDGIVVERAVEQGQTVNAGFSAPRLFVLAGDLGQMQILARVDEADIGQIRPEQPVSFAVQAYPDRTFEGMVSQIRLQSVNEQNIITYTVVVDVPNPEGVLLPGMTTTTSFIIARSPGAFCVPASALRFQPEASEPAGGAGKEGGRKGEGKREDNGGGKRGLWILPEDQESPQRVEVEVGLKGQACTEVKGEGLSEGMAVVVGKMASGSEKTNPLIPSQAPRR